ncbi:MAG: molybdopterin molybdotransferase MoeA, partial [Alphaproteobacteria bacterium]|nr:molybdopterin molybdotransferase MoeA [Alphaproteobacteria bacterium]
MISPAPEHTLRKGANIRQMGSDFARGRNLITRGTRLTAAHIALAAMAGHASLPVARPIRIALVSTGDELVPPGAATRPDQIPSTNAPMLKAMLYGWPVIITTHHVPDDQAQLTALLTTLSSMDIIVTLGGASVGDHDIVRPAITAAGGQIDLWKVAMRPGKPLIIGQFSDAILLGLPGNPVSAYVTARLFFLPFIAALSGDLDPKVEVVTQRLGAPLPANGSRTDHLRARCADGVVIPLKTQDSAGLYALSQADGFIVRLPYAPAAASGDDALFFFA